MAPRIQVRPTSLKHLIPRSSIRYGLQTRSVASCVANLPHAHRECITCQSPRQLSPQCFNARRNFTTSPLRLKKGGKAAKKEAAAEEHAEVEDPFDFSSLEEGVKSVHAKLDRDLQKLKTGGRFNPEILESVRVRLSKESSKTIRLGDLAQVLPKGGRSVMVLVGEAEHVKPIISAIQGSPELNLQPQQDAHNTSQLNIPIPPPTKESRDQALAAAHKAGETALVGVRNARASMQKKLRAMELKKAVRPDDLKKAHKDMEKLVEKYNADVKKTVDAARKAMEQS